jgi:hypothetical protein
VDSFRVDNVASEEYSAGDSSIAAPVGTRFSTASKSSESAVIPSGFCLSSKMVGTHDSVMTSSRFIRTKASVSSRHRA